MPLPLSTWLNFPLNTAWVIFPTKRNYKQAVGKLILTPPVIYWWGLSAAIKSGVGAFDKGVIALEEELGLLKSS